MWLLPNRLQKQMIKEKKNSYIVDEFPTIFLKYLLDNHYSF